MTLNCSNCKLSYQKQKQQFKDRLNKYSPEQWKIVLYV
jgi:transcription elongation factor Elf1